MEKGTVDTWRVDGLEEIISFQAWMFWEEFIREISGVYTLFIKIMSYQTD